MEYVIQFQINIFALFVLFSLLVILKLQAGILFNSKKLLLILIITSIVSIIMEPLSWIVDGIASPPMYILNYLSNSLLVLLSLVISGWFASYIDLKLFGNWQRIQRRWFYQQPSLLVLILLVFNFFVPIYFSIDRHTNQFEQKQFVLFNYALVIAIYLVLFVVILQNPNRMEMKLVRTVFLFLLIPIAGMIVQHLNKYLNFSWTTTSLAILIAYTFLETTPGEKDFLTDLYSRMIYDRYVSSLIAQGKTFRVMMIDLNNFKAINDSQGHQCGDFVLREFSKILKKVFASERLVARLAGDEFLVVIEHEAMQEQRFINQMVGYCLSHERTVMQTLRFGYGIERFTVGMTFDELYTKVDAKMYTHKQNMKRTNISSKVGEKG